MDITGHAGIGKACTLAFAKFGASAVVVADPDLEAAKAVATECMAISEIQTFRTKAIRLDVTSDESVTAAISDAVRHLGRIDCCVNSAGVGVQLAQEVAEADIGEFDNMYKVNVTRTFLVLRVMSAVMKAQEPLPIDPSSPARGTTGGSIVSLGSAPSFVATPKMVQYTAAKHAVLGLTKNAALDNAAYRVRVNSACPSWVDTPMVRKAIENVVGLGDMIKSAVPLGRIALTEEVADTQATATHPSCLSPKPTSQVPVPAKDYVQSFPVPGLRQIFRHITGHNEEGKSVFLRSDQGDHHRVMGEQQAVANILYSTQETPVELNGNVDIEKAKAQEPPLHYHNGSIDRMIDFGPGVESPLHLAVSIDYGIVVEGVFELILDSGEKRIMRQGDVSVQRATAHQWKTIMGNGTLPGRMMWILLDCNDVYVNGKKMEGFLGDLAKEYVDQGVTK
ncbi:hypothetical protein DL771_009216 [Monosporascus sp. 5C6A]|nr:hypothetical protein DL771_009216 [Monosporascus sp. 5C6A]